MFQGFFDSVNNTELVKHPAYPGQADIIPIGCLESFLMILDLRPFQPLAELGVEIIGLPVANVAAAQKGGKDNKQ